MNLEYYASFRETYLSDGVFDSEFVGTAVGDFECELVKNYWMKDDETTGVFFQKIPESLYRKYISMVQSDYEDRYEIGEALILDFLDGEDD